MTKNVIKLTLVLTLSGKTGRARRVVEGYATKLENSDFV